MQRLCYPARCLRYQALSATFVRNKFLIPHTQGCARYATFRKVHTAARTSLSWISQETSFQSLATDTIYALSSAPGPAAIAVVRISGPECISIYSRLCPDRPLPKPRRATLRKLYHPQDERLLLETGALLLYFPAPDTVTGEDVLELHVHGGPAIVRSVLDAIPRCAEDATKKTVRPAEAGEFTKRAFYNNRIDLTQAEALGESLAAETEQQRRLALSGASSALASRYLEWRRLLLYARGELEALIDFSEDQHFDESPAQFMKSVSDQVIELKRRIQLHIENASRGELLRSGITVALLGVPNAGKSSLLNRIVGREAAIVSAEEGTTRDIVDVTVDIAGWLVRLGDMAGLRGSNYGSDGGKNVGTVEKEGIRRARERALQSDLVVVLVSLQQSPRGSVELSLNDELLSAVKDCQTAGKYVLLVVNKTDLLHSQPLSQMRSLSSMLSRLMEVFPETSPNEVFCVSCKDAESLNTNEPDPGGIQTFLNGLVHTFGKMTSAVVAKEGYVAGTAADAKSYWTASLSNTHRQRRYLEECLHHLDEFLTLSPETDPAGELSLSTHHVDGHDDLIAERATSDKGDFLERSEVEPEVDIVTAAEHLRYAADCLARITGRSEAGDVEDVLGVVFEK